MANLACLPLKLDKKNVQCRAIVETPKGRRNKFDYDPESELFTLGFLLPEGMVFPFDFGFLPSTLGEDGDPVDVMILMDEPAHVGCLLDVRIVGAIEADQTEEGRTIENPRLLAVACHSYSHAEARSIGDLQSSMVDQIEQFFVTYNKLRGRKFKVLGKAGPKKALSIIRKGMAAFQSRKKGPTKD